MRKIILLLIVVLAGNLLFADELVTDSAGVRLNEVNIVTYKETNNKNTPVSSTLIKDKTIELLRIKSVKDLNGIVPNFFVPDYGSSMSSAVYIRGVGSRNSGQSMSLYVDNMPYMDKSAFDFELYDISQIEVLRGAQGTLYGRNSLGGIVNIFTLSPLTYQGTKISVSGGNYGNYNAKLSSYFKVNPNFGLSIGAYYQHNNGFFKNTFTNKYADPKDAVGGRVKTVWLFNSNTKVEYMGNIDFTNEGAFPYGLYDPKTKITGSPQANDLSHYKRLLANNVLSLKHASENVLLSATISHQYFKDQMDMDQDFTPKSIFHLQQNQTQNATNGELVAKSNNQNDFQWSLGANFSNQDLYQYAPVDFKEDGINMILRPVFDRMGLDLQNREFSIPGWYENRFLSGALFGQFTMNNILINGLSLTGGVRLDAENIILDYNTNAELNLIAKTKFGKRPFKVKDELRGNVKTQNYQVNPKLSIKYEWNRNNYLYVSATRGHKSGGFNVQMFSDLMNQKLMSSMNPKAPKIEVQKMIEYKPETSWNFETGVFYSLLENRLDLSAVLFYMDIRGLQLTQFVPNGTGRMLTNAGVANSKGVEASLRYKISKNWSVNATYGLANAQFQNYKTILNTHKEVDYKGKYVPYSPQNSVGANILYSKTFDNSFVNKLYINLNYSGIGKIYWNEANTLSENYYNLINAIAGVQMGKVGLDIWGRNLLNSSYNTFYFKSFDNNFFQKGKPLHFGATIKVEL